MKDASAKRPNALPVDGWQAGFLTRKDTISARNIPEPTSWGLRQVLRLSLQTLGSASLRELVISTLAVCPGVEAGTVLDALNDLVMSGTVAISKSGIFFPK